MPWKALCPSWQFVFSLEVLQDVGHAVCWSGPEVGMKDCKSSVWYRRYRYMALRISASLESPASALRAVGAYLQLG